MVHIGKCQTRTAPTLSTAIGFRLQQFANVARQSHRELNRMTEAETLQKFHEVADKATWAYLATAVGDQPKVRVVHPAFEGETTMGGDRAGNQPRPRKSRKIPRSNYSTRSAPNSFI